MGLPIQDLAEEHEQNTFSLVLTVEEKEQTRMMWAGYLFWQILSTTTLLAVPLTSSTSREPKFLRSFFEERANSRQGTDIAEDIDVLVGALKDCALDLYSCLLLPLVRDPKDPYLLAALGTTIFSGNLIAQTALRKSQPVVVVEDPGRSEYLPILLDDPVDTGSESGDISDEVSILISSPARAEARGELTFSGDTSTSTRPTDILAVGQESASDSLADIGLKQRRRTSGGKQKTQTAGEEANKKGGGSGRRKSGGGRQKAGRGRNRKSTQKTDEEEAKKKLKKEARRGTRRSYAVESRKGLASGRLKKQGNRISSTGALVSSVANSILRNAIGSSLKKSKDRNKVHRDQFRDLNNVTVEGDAPGGMLEDFPGCGSTEQTDYSNQQPWLGALYAVPPLYSENETDRFVVPVALLSAKTKLHPNWPTIIVATGDIFDTELVNSSSSSVSHKDLTAWGMKMEVRFALESPSGPLVLPVTSITWQPGFGGQEGQKEEEDRLRDLAAIEVDSANLWLSGHNVYPLCLPAGSIDQHTTITQVGWDIESSKLGEKLLRGATTTDDLGPLITLPAELEECGEHAAGGENSDTSLCFTSGAPSSPGWGSLILSSNESTNRVSLVGFSRRKSPHLPRRNEGMGSRIFCLLHWLAKLYGRTWPRSDVCENTNL